MEHGNEGQDRSLEHLVVRGRLDRAGQFTPRRCSSTTYVHSWPAGTPAEELARIGAGRGEVVVETVADDGDVLQRELAQVRSEEVCSPGEARTFRVLAYIGLHPRTESVRVRRDERVLWEMQLPEAPRVEVRLERAPRRGRRRGAGSAAVLALDFSRPADESLAFVTVVHQWGERGFRTVHLGPPERSISVETERLAGGPECRLLVTYSNGLRSASAITETFDLESLGPSVTIVRPSAADKLVDGVPVVLEGFVEDPERPSVARDVARLVWTVDDREVATGPVSSVDALERGRHKVALTYHGEPEASATVTVSVRATKEPTADQWEDWEAVELT